MQWKDFLQCSFTNTTIYVPNVFISIKFESYLTYSYYMRLLYIIFSYN